MKFLNQKKLSFLLVTLTLLSCLISSRSFSQVLKEPISEQTFASQKEAVATLKAAVVSNDRHELTALFGPEFNEMITGDSVQDTNNLQHFASKMAESCHIVNAGENKREIEVGLDNWPFPIPLVRVAGQWHYDTASGKQEIIDRHIGEDELSAIGVCRIFVIAQKEYAQANPNKTAEITYAQHLKSNPGQKDGLYWAPSADGTLSPLSQLVAEAQADGYIIHSRHTGRHPFHGYYFRVLSQQGDSAKGGARDYLTNGSMTGGFALVAYPEHWGQSGIMTFIVNQDGKVFQSDLGDHTDEFALAMKQYNPSPEWMPVDEAGVELAQ